jgi:ligand-binding sensor domain-containing protein/signal transduction histidine kinase
LSLRSSNTFRDERKRWARVFGPLLAGLFVACLAPSAFAVAPDRATTQYIRERWGPERGFPSGPVYAICQTTDGYLWIGTESGLVRFDGIDFLLLKTQTPSSAPLGPVIGLAADDEGNLWVRLWGPNMVRYRDGLFARVTSDLGWPNGAVSAMARTRSGALVLSAMGGGAMTYHRGRVETVAAAGVLPRSPVISIGESSEGDLWMGTRDAGLFRLSGREDVAPVRGSDDLKINCLLPGDAGALWLGTDTGVVRWDGTGLTRAGLPRALSHVQALAMSRDRDGNVWIGTAAQGLFRLNERGVAALDENGPGGHKAVMAVFEDREGNIWAGSESGIERLRDSAFVTYATAEGLPSESNGPVYVDAEGRAWFAPVDGGLSWLKDQRVGRVTAAGLAGDVVYSIEGRGGDLWIGRRHGGLTHLRAEGSSFTAVTYAREDGLAQNSVYAVALARDGAVWAGTLSGGVSRLSGGKFTTYTTANGLASNTVSSILETADGTMWFATPNGLSALSNGGWRVYGVEDGLLSENVSCLFEDSAGVLWVGTARGLAYFRAGRFEEPIEAPTSIREQILGIAEDRRGSLWMTTSNHVVRISRDAVLRGRLGEGDVVEYGIADGLRGMEGVKRHRSVVADPVGRIWISLNRGLSVVDPGRLTDGSSPTLVDIQAISADGSPIDTRDPIRIPASRQRITFDYAGLSFATPERVRFRYWLEGFDRQWTAPTASREAVYTNLGPGSYRFHVIASDSHGLWNGAESILEVTIEPAIWQTPWFRLACALAGVAMLFAVYRVRIDYVARGLNRRFEERLAERTRVAQELHDTLLQGFISASMQLQVAADLVAADSSAKPLIARIVELMRHVIDEGRNTLGGLRASSVVDTLELGQAFARIQHEMAVGEDVPVRVFVDGHPRPLHPVVRDEVYRIGREALVNACRHSRAKGIEVVLEYSARQLRVVIRDDGCGIDPQVLGSGREGHWGLVGMRERAERIRARLSIRSRPTTGTEVELSVPGRTAFQVEASEHALKRLARFRRRARARYEEASKGKS